MYMADKPEYSGDPSNFTFPQPTLDDGQLVDVFDFAVINSTPLILGAETGGVTNTASVAVEKQRSKEFIRPIEIVCPRLFIFAAVAPQGEIGVSARVFWETAKATQVEILEIEKRQGRGGTAIDAGAGKCDAPINFSGGGEF